MSEENKGEQAAKQMQELADACRAFSDSLLSMDEATRTAVWFLSLLDIEECEGNDEDTPRH